MSRKALAAAAAAVALLAAGSAQPHSHAPAKGMPLIGLLSDSYRHTLVRVDPVRLRARKSGRLGLDGYVSGWAFSPDKRLLALARWTRNDASFRNPNPSLRLVDPFTLKVVGDVPLARELGDGSALAWLARDRIVVLASECCGDGVDLVVADPVAQRVRERRPLEVDPLFALRSAGRLVVLAAPAGRIAPVRLLLIDAAAHIETVVLDRIAGGYERVGEGDDRGVNALQPALTLSPNGTRAFVFSPAGLAAEIDLASLVVEYHPIAHGRLARRLPAKRYTYSSVSAQTLPSGLIALTGSSQQPYLDKSGKEQMRHDPAGLQLVDTNSWTVRAIDATADSFAFASDRLLTRDLLLVTGYRWDSAENRDTATTGLSAYTLDGKRVFRLFKNRRAAVDYVYRNRAYVNVDSDLLRVVNLGSGRVVGKRSYKTIPWLVNP